MLVGNMGWTRVKRDGESDELFMGCIYQNYSVEYLLYLGMFRIILQYVFFENKPEEIYNNYRIDITSKLI